MGKYGKKKDVDLNPLHYNICLLGESGIGKTTITKEMCEQLVGEDGYIHFDVGRECGADAIQGIVSETLADWEKLSDVVDDIIENKQEDYPHLQVVIWDTLDELILLAEAESIRLYNKKTKDKKADSINAAYGGFGKGQGKAIELMLDKIWGLKKVGVNSIIIGHVKRAEVTDTISQDSYSTITADTQQRYFNAIKNKMHFVGLAYVDRDIVKEKTGKQNIVTKQDIMTNKVVSESRVISFRDDTYSIDSKSRFSEIVDHIPFDSTRFIEAMRDAIEKERSKSGKSLEEFEMIQKEKDENALKMAEEFSKEAKENKIDEERNAELVSMIQSKYTGISSNLKNQVKAIMKENGFSKFSDDDIPTKALEEIVALLG